MRDIRHCIVERRMLRARNDLNLSTVAVNGEQLRLLFFLFCCGEEDVVQD